MSDRANGATSTKPWSTEAAPARMVARSVWSLCAYPFASRRANGVKILLHDVPSIWLANRRLQH